VPHTVSRERWKIAAGIILILATITWLAISGIRESSTYYVTVGELKTMGEEVQSRRLRVGGDVLTGSIQREGGRVTFVLEHEEHRLPVVYVGTDPLPDTFRDRAQALADGSYGPDGVFVAKRIQAKCASKYEAETPGGSPPQAGAGSAFGTQPAASGSAYGAPKGASAAEPSAAGASSEDSVRRY
jgi:cytochrome c-type biogenesis protein CcmE